MNGLILIPRVSKRVRGFVLMTFQSEEIGLLDQRLEVPKGEPQIKEGT